MGLGCQRRAFALLVLESVWIACVVVGHRWGWWEGGEGDVGRTPSQEGQKDRPGAPGLCCDHPIIAHPADTPSPPRFFPLALGSPAPEMRCSGPVDSRRPVSAW